MQLNYKQLTTRPLEVKVLRVLLFKALKANIAFERTNQMVVKEHSTQDCSSLIHQCRCIYLDQAPSDGRMMHHRHINRSSSWWKVFTQRTS